MARAVAMGDDAYRRDLGGGLRLALEAGRLAAVEDWRRPAWGEPHASFPSLVFVQLLFGYRGLHELRGLAPDNWVEGEAAPVLDALFPKRPTSLVGLD